LRGGLVSGLGGGWLCDFCLYGMEIVWGKRELAQLQVRGV